MQRRGPTDGPLTLRRLERAMVTLCRVMRQLPDEEALKLVPLYERMDREISTRSTGGAALAAARRRANLKD